MAMTAAGALLGAHLPLLVGGGAITALRDRFDGPVLATGIRIAAAWVAAIALLLLAFLLRPAA